MVKPSSRIAGLNALAAFLLLCGSARGGELRSIELTDGSVVVGQVLSAQNGTYTIQNSTLGIITLRDAEIVSMRAKGQAEQHSASPPEGSSPMDASTLQALQKQLLSDPNISDAINTLKDDSDIQQVLKDPELVRAIQSGDLEQLKTNPKIQNLIASPGIQGILKNFQH